MKTNLSALQTELRETMETWGCPLCHRAIHAEQQYLDSLNYERVQDLGTRTAIKASHGLCAYHSRVWQSLHGSALGIALVYRDVLSDLQAALEISPQAQAPAWPWQKERHSRLADALAPHGTCPACEIRDDTARRFAEILLRDLREESVQHLLEQCGGLCLPHLRMALSLPGAARVQDVLIAVQKRAWQTIRAELDEFIRKNDYRFRHEPLGAEGDSWQRILDVVVGLPHL